VSHVKNNTKYLREYDNFPPNVWKEFHSYKVREPRMNMSMVKILKITHTHKEFFSVLKITPFFFRLNVTELYG
jgi:hypothetical protein